MDRKPQTGKLVQHTQGKGAAARDRKLQTRKLAQHTQGKLAAARNLPRQKGKHQCRKLAARVEEERLDGERKSNKRMARFDRSAYPCRPREELFVYFPRLGVQAKRHVRTKDNKTVYRNMSTGWSLCYDDTNNYSTVQNDRGHYVALDGTTLPNGTMAKFHFRDD